MKVFAYYLPQFHEDENNNKWWGKGFTEWTNLRRITSLYKGHNQPRIPLNNNYYNLEKKETMEWQTRLMREYKIDGLCYYHYWSEGKKLLNRPAENLLEWKDVEQNFCFFWANHSWRKDWIGEKTILFEQKYGTEVEWKMHFEYLKKFFLDNRYIKINNKPLFIIYNKYDIENYEQLINYFNYKCIEIGFSGIKVVVSINKEENIRLVEKDCIIREPDCSLNKRTTFEKLLYKFKREYKVGKLITIQKYNYERFLNKSFEVAKNNINANIYPTIFTGWDNTPRYKERGFVLEGSNPELFKKYLLKYKKLMKEKNCEYIFINAWNEWTEGMYLEPDQMNEYKYLEAVKEVVETEV